ncbi:MAG: hypothetical protein ACNA8W_26300, partial [Bradymonadaceae bacterium]
DIEGLTTDQAAYRQACEALGMEVIVPRTRAHALSIFSFNQNATPNLVNVFPRYDGAVGLSEWEGRCRGEPCSFFISETNSSGCMGDAQPSGNNSVGWALYATRDTIRQADDRWCYGRWVDGHNDVYIRGYVLCSTNDAMPD